MMTLLQGFGNMKITSIPMFAKCVDSEQELKPAFLTPTSQENSMAEASKLKLAWEAACLLAEKILKRGLRWTWTH